MTAQTASQGTRPGSRGHLRERRATFGRLPEPEQVHERLQNLRTIVPVFAQELAAARRRAEELRLENRRLQERIRDLQRRARMRGR